MTISTQSTADERFVDLACDVVPSDLRAGWETGAAPLLIAARNHPCWSSLLASVGRDARFATLLTEHGFFCTTGTGFVGLDAEGLVDDLLVMTWRRLHIKHERHPAARLRATARSVVNDVVRLAAGEVVQVPAWFMWDGPQLDAGRALHGHFGSLRWVPDLAIADVSEPPYGGLTLYTTLPVAIIPNDRPGNDADFYGAENVTQRAFDRRDNQVKLALLDDVFDPPDASPYAAATGPPARLSLAAVSAPGSDLGHQFVKSIDPVAAGGTIIDPRGVERRLDFYSRNWNPAADLAARRLAASGQDGRHDDDALVDAVTAWESLLGTPSETTFKVTAAMARLMEDSLDRRVELQRELKRLYTLRSRAVHGAADLTLNGQAILDERRRRATTLGTKLLRIMLGTRKDLLELKTEDRAAMVLLE